MKAKLIKEGSFGYKIKFYNDDDMAACALGLLSLKNCQAIELGYDLDELAKREYLDGYDTTELCRIAFKDGFQKAVKLMGDKKFSEQDVILIAEYIRVASQSTPSVKTKDLFDEYQSLQQTEWEVEIVGSGTVYKTVLDCCPNYHPKFGCSEKDGCSCISNELPKLDADGCLILKRK